MRLQVTHSTPTVPCQVDRHVTGLIAQQQCVGPLQLPISDVAVMAQTHFGYTGAATAIGEQASAQCRAPADTFPVRMCCWWTHCAVTALLTAKSIVLIIHRRNNFSCPYVQPYKGLINPEAMARLALGEALTNLVRLS